MNLLIAVLIWIGATAGTAVDQIHAAAAPSSVDTVTDADSSADLHLVDSEHEAPHRSTSLTRYPDETAVESKSAGDSADLHAIVARRRRFFDAPLSLADLRFLTPLASFPGPARCHPLRC